MRRLSNKPSYRVNKVADEIKRFISTLILNEIKDPRVDMVSITDVILSKDLKNAKVYFSVLGDDKKVKRAIAGLISATGFIKREIGRNLKLRFVPDVKFYYDESLSYGVKMDSILNDLQ